jgi:hypothetical protein
MWMGECETAFPTLKFLLCSKEKQDERCYATLKF